MPLIDTIDLAYGIPLIVVIPAIVQIAKVNGLPTRLAGPAAMVTATVLIALADVALGTTAAGFGQRLATWLVGGIVYGLAAAGFYSLTPIRAHDILPSGNATRADQHGAADELRDNTPSRPAGADR